MKRIISVLLCLVMALVALVGCDKNTIGDYMKNYPDDEDKDKASITLNMYIIADSGTTDNATTTVAQRLNQHTTNTYSIGLNVTYVNASNYESKEATLEAYENLIKSEVNKTYTSDNENENNKQMPHLVLVTSKALYDSLYSANKLVDITPYLNTKAYGKLNAQIAKPLMQSARDDSGKLFAIPNNHVVGGTDSFGTDAYTYLVINKEVAQQQLFYTTEELSSYTSIEDAAKLREDIVNAGFANPDEYVFQVSGDYTDKAEYEKAGNICNVVKYPTATPEEVFSSAYAIINNPNKAYNDAAMQIIYAINTDTQLRNLLQYGNNGIHFNFDNDAEGASETVKFVERIKDDSNNYFMNIVYTGDVFKANYCEEIGWTPTVNHNGVLHNNDSTFEK